MKSITLLGCVVALTACATVPEDPYQRALYYNDRNSALCGIGGSGFGTVACQQRVSAERQQIVAEEMARRQREDRREQTREMREAIQSTAAQPVAPAPAAPPQWCMMIVDGSKAVEGCYPDRAACNSVWGDVRAAGKATTDCVEKVPAAAMVVPAAAPVPAVAPSKWCTNVAVEGGTSTESCYPDRAGCDASRSFHSQSGVAASECVGK